jgi:uncharacterized protein (DUF2344 family)
MKTITRYFDRMNRRYRIKQKIRFWFGFHPAPILSILSKKRIGL